MALIETERPAQRTATRDTALRDWVRALEATAPITANPQRLLLDVIEEQTDARGDAPALLSAEECLTYDVLTSRANAYARWALTRGIARGEVVALMMPNRPEYLAIWLGLTSVGIVVALINTQLRGSSLAHCIDIAAPNHAIVAAEFCSEFRAATAQLTSPPKIWSDGRSDTAEAERFDLAVEALSEKRLTPAERRAVSIKNRALLIYTSGTTRLPKAAYSMLVRRLVGSELVIVSVRRPLVSTVSVRLQP